MRLEKGQKKMDEQEKKPEDEGIFEKISPPAKKKRRTSEYHKESEFTGQMFLRKAEDKDVCLV